jgi:transcriptional regulator with XRE-family HTH domain
MGENDIGVRIRDARQAAGMSQRQLSALSGIAQQTITRLETGLIRPKLDTVEKLAQALGMPLNVLMGIEAQDLTGEEATLLSRFRSLTPEQRRALLLMIGEIPGPKK